MKNWALTRIRLLMLRIADEHRLPFEVRIPNKATHKAMHELEKGKNKQLDSVSALLNELNVED